MQEHTIRELQEQMASGTTTAREVVSAYLARIEALDRAGPALNAVIELNPDRVEGFYFAGVNLYLHAECYVSEGEIPDDLVNRVERLINQAIRMDRYFLQGAPLIAKARLLNMLTFPQRDKKWITDILSEVKRKFPKNPHTDLCMVDFLINNGEPPALELVLLPVSRFQEEMEVIGFYIAIGDNFTFRQGG